MLSLILMALAGQAAAAATPPSCASPEHRQFDFWVGRWAVTKRGDTKVVAHSVVERLYAGCAIRENWMPLGGSAGGSLNSWDPDLRKWRQVWVDASNAWVEFQGGINADVMQLSGTWRNAGGPGVNQVTRISWSRMAGGTVRQFGEITTDGGKHWQPSFDFLYTPES